MVVLGCRLAWRDGVLVGAAGRRARRAAEAVALGGDALVVASGGRVWGGVVEADGLRDELVRLGVPGARVLRERCSQTTRENARFTRELLARRALRDVVVVTCDWHAPRAAAVFRRLGLVVAVAPAETPPSRWLRRAWLAGRERVAARIDDLVIRRRGWARAGDVA